MSQARRMLEEVVRWLDETHCVMGDEGAIRMAESIRVVIAHEEKMEAILGEAVRAKTAEIDRLRGELARSEAAVESERAVVQRQQASVDFNVGNFVSDYWGWPLEKRAGYDAAVRVFRDAFEKIRPR